ncbi:DUF5133 domain-containing protein [Streptomyces sp. NPDC005283]|uniref:DUF5133 domain-containing protein n=1 Tax=Streptomyces sp. NPDC005283 TaxID=3156871 RepID=UPI003453419D
MGPRLAALLAEDTENSTSQTRRELEDVTYTPCVSTGTLTIEAALAVAEQRLAAALTDPQTTATGAVQLTA